MNWEQCVNRLQKTSAYISLFLNSTLILLIVKRSPEQLGSYRYLMIYTALFETFYSFVDVVVSPIIYSHGAMSLVVISTKNSIFSKDLLSVMSYVWCGCFGCFMMLFCIQFIYRYYAVVGSMKIKSFNVYRLVYWIMIPFLLGTAWGNVVYAFIGPRKQIDDVLRDLVLKELDLEIDEITYVGTRVYHRTENGNSVLDIDSLVAIFFMLIIMSSSLSCILYYAIKTFLNIKDTLSIATMSENHKMLQSQTFYALVTQTIIPVILLHFPCSSVMVAALMDIDLGHLSGISSVTFALFPALDPLPVMLIIQNYRGALFNVMSTPVTIFVRRQIRSK